MRFFQLTVSDVRPETADAVAISFDLPAALKPIFRFEPGQYVTVQAPIDGIEVRRPYSICSPIDGHRLSIGVKRVPEGLFSTYAQKLRAGDRLGVAPPQGNFQWLGPAEHPVDERPCHHLAIAAGSGITPILAILSSALHRRPRDTFTLFYGNHGPSTVMFLEALHDLKDRAMERLRIVHVFSREQTELDLHHGRLDAKRLRLFEERGYFSAAATDAAYVCGPGDMNEQVRAALTALGLPAARVRSERFTLGTNAAPESRARHDAARVNKEPSERTTEVEAIVDGVRRTLHVTGDEDVISAAERLGVDLPFSCRGGMCCTCRCKVLEGHVRMDVCYSLEPWERDAGFVLACQARATTPRLVLDFDAR